MICPPYYSKKTLLLKAEGSLAVHLDTFGVRGENFNFQGSAEGKSLRTTGLVKG